MPTTRLVPLTGWKNPASRFKERIRALREIDRRMTERRVVFSFRIEIRASGLAFRMV